MKTWLDAAEEVLMREGPGGTLHLKDMLVKIQHARLIDSRCVVACISLKMVNLFLFNGICIACVLYVTLMRSLI